MLETGTVVQDRYRVVRLLGQGGMGAVYRAWDLRLKVPVALKELRPQPGLDEEMLQGLREQFEQEAAVLARLNHPGLVRVTDYFEEQSNAYLVMDFVDGRSLVDIVIQEGAQSEAKVVEWARQLLEALAYCHAQGVVHRDIKPQNIIVKPDGNVVLVDFGLVKLWDPNDPRTRTVMRGMGTPEYAPPEQYGAVTDHTGPPSDIYSLGATLYHLLTGRAPATATERMAMPETFRPLRELAPHVSERIEHLVMKALSLSVSERWQTAREMLAVLVSGPLPAYDARAPQPAVSPPPITPTVMAPSGSYQPSGGTGPAQEPAAPAAQKRPRRLWIGIAVVVVGCGVLGCLGFLFGRPFLADMLGGAAPTATVTVTLAPTLTMTPALGVTPTATESSIAVADTPIAETPAVGGFTITVENRSPDEVCYVLISPSASDQWGDDWLAGDEVIAPGGERAFDVPDGPHDVRLVRCDQATMLTGWEIALDQTIIVSEPGAEVGVLVENHSATDVCYLYISPSSADDWGMDWLGDLETLPSGGSRVVYVYPGSYDLQAAGCDNQVLVEEYEVSLVGDFTWTLTD